MENKDKHYLDVEIANKIISDHLGLNITIVMTKDLGLRKAEFPMPKPFKDNK